MLADLVEWMFWAVLLLVAVVAPLALTRLGMWMVRSVSERSERCKNVHT